MLSIDVGVSVIVCRYVVQCVYVSFNVCVFGVCQSMCVCVSCIVHMYYVIQCVNVCV
jgi:hypothetical protein